MRGSFHESPARSDALFPFASEAADREPATTHRPAQSTNDVEERRGATLGLLRLVGMDWTAPDFSTLCRRQRTLNVSIPYRGGTGPLNLLIDSTGIKAEGEGEWNARKHGGPKRRIWRKIHIGIDEETLEVRAVEITGSNIGDAPVLPDLLDQIPADEQIGSVTADGAYDTRKCH